MTTLFYCHICRTQYTRYDMLKGHRVQDHPYDFVQGVPFFMLEDEFENAQDQRALRIINYFEDEEE